ncbi:hypothetical protein [Sporosarcina sp. ZBG7A]|uniref:hypothetical protein n=1 Tax=Sporosarcina sp. ZBG7A TaxID=1582223 RepID=UPI00057B79B2|nr:hypothetical protein [Sporosarcina sp. ZBG7A]
MKKGVGVLLLLSILCATGLFYSASVWKNKVHEAAESKSSTTIVKETDNDNSTEDPSTPSQEVQKEVPKIDALSATLDARVKEQFTKKFSAGEHVNVLVIGSDSIGPVAERFATTLSEAFGNFVTVDAVTADLTSSEFIKQGLPNIDWSPGYDIVLYEPFTLNNNGEVVIEQEQRDLLTVQASAKQGNEQVAFIVTPPQPIYEANYYQTQIQSLEKFTKSKNLLYINHWSDWPSTSSPELLDYVDKERQLSTRGVKVWSDAIIHTFLQ